MKAIHSIWDSRVFGKRVGQLETKRLMSAREVRAENREFDVVFVKFSGWADPSPGMEALDNLYDMELERAPSKTTRSVRVVPAGPKHIGIAQTAFKDSRFLRDPRLAGKSGTLYARWLAKKNVYVLRGHPKNAFLLASSDGDVRRISLIAVDEASRGCGLGRRLLSGVLMCQWHRIWRVKVSVRNHQAIRFYENAGFRVARVSTAYHVWIK